MSNRSWPAGALVAVDDLPEFIMEQLEAIEESAEFLAAALRFLADVNARRSKLPPAMAETMNVLTTYAQDVLGRTEALRQQGELFRRAAEQN